MNAAAPIARFQTDDRDYDLDEQREFIIQPNGDNGWLVDVVPVGEESKKPVVVLAHGEKAKNPLLAILIGRAYNSILHSQDPAKYPLGEIYGELLSELNAWKIHFREHNQPSYKTHISMDSSDFAEFMSDDDSLPESERKIIRFMFGGNCDWYAQAFTKKRFDWRGVRFSTSGGAGWRVPLLCVNIAESYHAIMCQEQYKHQTLPSYEEALAKCGEYRARAPELQFRSGFLEKKPVCEEE